MKAETNTFEPLWTWREVAAFLRLSRSWVYREAEAGRLPCLNVGGALRFEPIEIRKFARGEWVPPRRAA